MSVCVCGLFFILFYLLNCRQTAAWGEKYLSKADLCCLEAQHFKPSLSCAHKYQNSSLCYHLPHPPAPTTFTPLGSNWRIMQIYLAIALPFCCCPFTTAPPSAPIRLTRVRRVEAAKLHWIIAWAVCLHQLRLLDDISPTWYRLDSPLLFSFFTIYVSVTPSVTTQALLLPWFQTAVE